MGEPFLQGLRELGHVPSQTLTVDRRCFSTVSEAREVVLEFINHKVAVIVAVADAGPIASQMTRTVPLVVLHPDPLAAGLVSSLARPGGNITGLSFGSGHELVAKRLEFLKEGVPSISRVAAFVDAGGREQADTAARRTRVALQTAQVRTPEDLETALRTIAAWNASAVVDPTVRDARFLFSQRRRIHEWADQNRLPTVCGFGLNLEGRCLISYGVNFSALLHRAATYVDKILKGTKPGELPVEEPTKFELKINLKAAKALRLTIQPSLLLRADQVVE
jgi:putative ABC transport system substrate-binding protein